MSMITMRGYVPKDQLMSSAGPDVTSRFGSRVSSTGTAKSANVATPGELPLATNRQAGSLNPTVGIDQMTRDRFGPLSTTDSDSSK